MKYNLIKESLSFQRGGDPKEILGIGDEYKRIFNTENELVNYIIRNLPHILGTTEIPKDIISQPNKFIREKYFSKIRKYLDKRGITVKGKWPIGWSGYLLDGLKNIGFKVDDDVHESLLFQRGADPKDVLGIGDYYRTDFNSEEDLLEYLIRNLPRILGTKRIPKDIISEPQKFIRTKYFQKIGKYVGERNISINGSRANLWNVILRDELRKMGYKIALEESLSFTRGNDPKEVLGIGDYKNQFDSDEEFADYLVMRLPIFIGTKEIPENIITQQHKIIRQKYFDKIDAYISKKNIKVGQWRPNWNSLLRDRLKEMGYKTYVRKPRTNNGYNILG